MHIVVIILAILGMFVVGFKKIFHYIAFCIGLAVIWSVISSLSIFSSSSSQWSNAAVIVGVAGVVSLCYLIYVSGKKQEAASLDAAQVSEQRDDPA